MCQRLEESAVKSRCDFHWYTCSVPFLQPVLYTYKRILPYVDPLVPLSVHYLIRCAKIHCTGILHGVIHDL